MQQLKNYTNNAVGLITTAGMISQGCWYQILFLNSHVALGAFVVMPNHVHGVLILDEMENDNDDNDVAFNDNVEALESNASTLSSSNNTIKNSYFQNISPKSGSVSRIVQQYKTVCTKHICKACPSLNFEWQTRFYDHIIRNDHSFQNITNYIFNNPKNWYEDKFFNF